VTKLPFVHLVEEGSVMRVPPIVVSALLIAGAGALPASSATASRELVVYLTSTGFSPHASVAAAGDRVRITVRDRKPHQVAKASGPNSGDVPPNVLEGKGSSVTLMPQEPGAYVYVDRLSAGRPEYRLTIRH
jgi:plastocyanin